MRTTIKHDGQIMGGIISAPPESDVPFRVRRVQREDVPDGHDVHLSRET